MSFLNTEFIILLSLSEFIFVPLLIFNELFPFTNKAYGVFLSVLLKFKYLAHAPLILFSILSFDISIPKTNDNLAAFHFGKSPPFPQAKSIKFPPLLETANINLRLTYKL